MKRHLLFAVLVSCLTACLDSRETTDHKSPKLYDKGVGEQIPFSVATRWAESFNAATLAGRTASTFSLEADALAHIIDPVNERLGVVFHHGMDSNKDYRLMMYALDQDAELFKNKIVDLASGQIVDASTARAWAKQYAESHPATPWYHFFGRDVFVEIQSKEAFNYIEIVRGLNEELAEQVLLFVYNTKRIAGGKIQGESVTVYDVSQTCPPCSSVN
ncbi:MAG TPA: hypothetical protein VGD40_00455 [Chryseosolibacter sp.]